MTRASRYQVAAAPLRFSARVRGHFIGLPTLALLTTIMLAATITGCVATADAGAVISPEHASGRSGGDFEVRAGAIIPPLGLLSGFRVRVARDWWQVAGTVTAVGRIVLIGNYSLLLDVRLGLALGTDSIEGLDDRLTSLSPYGEVSLLWHIGHARNLGFETPHIALTLATEYAGRFDHRGPGTDEGLLSVRIGFQHLFTD